MKHSRIVLALSVTLTAAALASVAAEAQGYPNHPIRMVVPFSPGGTTDTPGRIIAQRLSEALGQPIIVENKPGAGSTIGTDFVAKAKPDGYTLLLTSTTHVLSPHLYKNLPYDPLKDFEPITLVASGPYVLVVNPSLPVKSVRELIALAKAQPGKIDYATSGNGSSQHLVGALFASMAGIQLNHVPYRGSGPATADLIGGQVKVGFPGTPIALPHIKSGRLRALAVTTKTRSPELPDVPTIAESGVPGYEATIWLGLLAPAGTPREIIDRLNSEVSKVLRNPEVQKSVLATGVEATSMTPEEFGRFLHSEYEMWGKVVREAHAVVN